MLRMLGGLRRSPSSRSRLQPLFCVLQGVVDGVGPPPAIFVDLEFVHLSDTMARHSANTLAGEWHYLTHDLHPEI